MKYGTFKTSIRADRIVTWCFTLLKSIFCTTLEEDLRRLWNMSFIAASPFEHCNVLKRYYRSTSQWTGKKILDTVDIMETALTRLQWRVNGAAPWKKGAISRTRNFLTCAGLFASISWCNLSRSATVIHIWNWTMKLFGFVGSMFLLFRNDIIISFSSRRRLQRRKVSNRCRNNYGDCIFGLCLWCRNTNNEQIK